jgi:hypothetical protein
MIQMMMPIVLDVHDVDSKIHTPLLCGYPCCSVCKHMLLLLALVVQLMLMTELVVVVVMMLMLVLTEDNISLYVLSDCNYNIFSEMFHFFSMDWPHAVVVVSGSY